MRFHASANRAKSMRHRGGCGSAIVGWMSRPPRQRLIVLGSFVVHSFSGPLLNQNAKQRTFERLSTPEPVSAFGVPEARDSAIATTIVDRPNTLPEAAGMPAEVVRSQRDAKNRFG